MAPRTALLGLALLLPHAAHAVDCEQIMGLLAVDVPVGTVITTMEGSGQTLTAEDVSCLRTRGAPAEVVAKAEALSGARARPAPAPAPAPNAFEAAPTLGEELTTEDVLNQDELEDAGGGPIEVEDITTKYRSKKYLTASQKAYELLQANKYPNEETKIQYYLAKSLYDLELWHGAQHYFMQVVRRGPSNPYFKYALPRMVAIAELTGNDTELLRIVHKIPPESFPRQAKNHLYYLMGRKLFEDGELAAASSYFQQISAKSDLYMRARYLDGIINTQRGKLKSAVLAFRDVKRADPPILTADQAREIADLQDLAVMNVGRIYYGLENFENAEKYYDLIQHDSTYWPESVFERAWASFWVRDLNRSLGLLLTVQSPYFSDTEFIPEITILRALNYWNLCEYDEVDRTLLAFEADVKPMVAEIQAFVEQYKSAEGRKLADQAYDTYFGHAHPDSRLHKALFARVLRNRDLSALVRHMDIMDAEVKTIDAQTSVWRDTLGDNLKRVIAQDRQRYKRRAGLLLLKELVQQSQALNDLLMQSEIIRFEVVDAQRADYMYKMQNPDVEAISKRPPDFATSRDIIYWPFNGEFWRDELGYYRYTEHGSCK